MSVRALTVAVATLVWAAPATAQGRGTMEFGAFASAAAFDRALTLTSAYGGGGRIGMFLDPRWAVEFEKGEMRAGRPDGLRDVNVGILAGRLTAIPLKTGALSFLVGAGAGVSTETNFMHSYGVDGLVGAKLALGENAALRVDGVWDWLANEQWRSYRTVRAGLSLYRRPTRAMRTAARSTIVYRDSVSAEETLRLRGRDAALRQLRDSLAGAGGAPPASAARATMEAEIHFAFDKSDLTDSAKTVLEEKVAVFRANPAMTVVLLGYTDVTGTDAYNMALGARRAAAARDFIVARGIAADRVIVESRGERQQITNSTGAEGEADNRRAQFRLLIAPDVINAK
jgi:outer membrane protein OmpA-like peptidoglycan-associated protein